MSCDILVIEDDPGIARIIGLYLERDGHRVTAVGDGLAGLRAARDLAPDLIVLDLMLPRLDGMEVCRTLREESEVPIIMATARVDEEDRLAGLDLGADDYIVKPFSPTELAARVQAALRRRTGPARMAPSEPYVRGDLTIDYAQRLVSVAGEPVRLTAVEYDLLRELSIHAGRVLTHQHLLQRVWGKTAPGTPRVIRTHLMRLRRKPGEDGENPKYIFAEPRVGYRMERPEAPREATE